MTTAIPSTALQLRSLVKPEGELEVTLARIPTPVPADDEVLVQLQASPLNPSDLGLLFGAADLGTARFSGTAEQPVLTAQVPPAAMKSMQGRLGQSLPVGNEGAGLVVLAGASPAAQALLGKRVAVIGGGMYAQYRAVPAASRVS
jgi:NADPH:quinone reductase-like Zn-dependent oxidoreductase